MMKSRDNDRLLLKGYRVYSLGDWKRKQYTINFAVNKRVNGG